MRQRMSGSFSTWMTPARSQAAEWVLALLTLITLFPECVAKGSRFTFGGLGVDPCSRDPAFGLRNRLQPFATVRNRLQPSATVCNRLQPSVCDRRGRKVAVPMGKVAKT